MELLGGTRCPAWVAVSSGDVGSDGVKSSPGFSFNIVADSPAGPETGDNLTSQIYLILGTLTLTFMS